MTISAIRHQIWNGKIPIRITVDEPESIGRQEYLISASRVSYLWLYLRQALTYFDQYLDDEVKSSSHKSSWWSEFDSHPLPFHWPIGLIHDSMVGPPTGQPWDLVLKRGNFPSTIIPINDTDSTLRSLWMNSLKESCYIRNGNSRAVMSMSVQHQDTMWKAIEAMKDPRIDTADRFWQCASPLFRRTNSSDMKIPLRFYLLVNGKINVIQQDMLCGTVMGDAMEIIRDRLGVITEEPITDFRAFLHGVDISQLVKSDQLYILTSYADGFLHIALSIA